MKELRVIISGGGTGGHIFPAIAIANNIKERYPNSTILFVGAEGRMEMEKVPAAGYEIIGLEVAGLNRKNIFKNFSTILKFRRSLKKARQIINDFKPQVAIGVGGYASGPILYQANKMKIPTLIQEQNSYAGVTNKFLGKKASTVCVAYEGMERFFPKDKIVITGNPYRKELLSPSLTKEDAYKEFDLDPDKKTILLIGGSLGSRTLNKSIFSGIDAIAQSDIQLIWQCGKLYSFELNLDLASKGNPDNVHMYEFISRMDLAYTAADLVISRAGASSITELSLLGKATILVPSPNVSEDHQTKNAMALVNNEAAILIKDSEAMEKLIPTVLETINSNQKLNLLSENILKLAHPGSTDMIVDEVIKLVK
ncbi:UDP-N-acetylglucosamine--N-acetylmuramyl-(pentapeptide) pyrophosphoryl-undecaprenol N-acetylglucosamine transferase [Dysgonomonas hofstadii]|uniref:UDP-N-acetylglucosamine--N-acetylmuramyl-(pentapeptide) pyrophosphoryl-undecaprenol N-acetylglucosamine transferase n=1 Tax=Dysgonomonas hofstadii TaxID=637886 RepID=A0A840CET2_9BACT|nr:undecaprenyldiphospho-muramoylpentapeptide beta-N-acetylglucosaminyltransferase [Dysgonomonas hofstadii]MBB4034460.1 UDP-N-acetylglucosamine--N-acetylmuramyl-(pentapeptide) pyrophosphoryl-undecaprenol N-acetylglucosamine transferase [Dysgonomonas hofstadii]